MSRAEGSRRSLFAGAAAVLTLGSVPMATAVVLEPDAVLVAIGKEAAPLLTTCYRLSDEYFSLLAREGTAARNAGIERVCDALDPLYERLEALTEQALKLPATTLAGFAAKAALLRHQRLICARSVNGIHLNGEDEWGMFNLLGELATAGAA